MSKDEKKDVDLKNGIEKLTGNEMKALLVELSGTKYWKAILSFNEAIYGSIEEVVMSTDPVGSAVLIARAQGQGTGVKLLESAVKIYKEEIAAIEKNLDNVKKG